MRLKRKLILMMVGWFALVQTLMPAMVLADELSASGSATPSFSPTPSPTPNAIVETGDAYATSESLGITNTTSINSDLDVVQGDVINPDGDIVLFSPSLATESASPISTPSASTDLTVGNQATATVAAETIAETGGNTQETTGSAEMTTGDAVTTAYATNITNTTLINSELEIALLTLLTPWDGNIILQPLSLAERDSLAMTVGSLYISNTGEVVTEASTTTITGNNVQITDGEASMTTGSVFTSASATSLVNTTLVDAILFDFLVHNLSLWSGQVYNWTPGSRQNPEEIVGRHLLGGSEQACEGCLLNTEITNGAQVRTSAYASSSTGGNSQTASESAGLITGNAYASAKATSVVNTTLINAKYRLIDLTLFAPWSGNLIFAYPDLEVSIQAPESVMGGEQADYKVVVSNNGYGEDTGVVLKVGDQLVTIGEMAAFQTISQTFTLKTDGPGETIIIEAAVGGDKEEETLGNNTATTTVIIMEPNNDGESSAKTDGVSHEIPVLNLTASNNIGAYIYPGDTTRYEATITNNGPGTAYDTVFVNIFYDSKGEVIGTIRVLIGHLKQGEKRLIKFSLNTSKELLPGAYYTISQIVGRSDDRTEVLSNSVNNPVPIQGSIIAMVKAEESQQIVPTIEAAGGVLGVQNKTCAACRSANWLFVITTALAALYTYQGRKLRSRRLLNMGVGWGVLGYITLLLVNPECANGLSIVTGSFLCKYFLPLIISETLIMRVFTAQKTLQLGGILALTRKMSRQ